MATNNVILLVEDNPDDEALTLRALKKNNIKNQVVVAYDGVEALDYLFAAGVHAGRDASEVPQVVLLDLKLPKIDGLEVLRRVRADERTKLLPVELIEVHRLADVAVGAEVVAAEAVLLFDRRREDDASMPSGNSASAGSS